jgi:dTDP-glucose pyrophosphorylase
MDSILKLLVPDSKVAISYGNTNDAVCSCLLAIDYINNDEPLLIAGCNQYINSDLNSAANYFLNSGTDGGVIVFNSVNVNMSFVKLDDDGHVVEAREKYPISNIASTGCYYYKNGNEFVKYAMTMIYKRQPLNGKYYLCPIFNEMILESKRVNTYQINTEDYFHLRSRKDYERFESFMVKS